MFWEFILKGKKVLIIDGDLHTHEIVEELFSRVGAKVITAKNGEEGLAHLYSYHPDLVILDYVLLGLDGGEVCRQIRQLSDVPIIVLTAVHDQHLELRSLDAGATDFITKPFNTRVLLARAKAALRKVRQAAAIRTQAIFSDPYLYINIPERIVRVQSQVVNLTAKELRLLAYLISHAGRVVTSRQILNFLWPAQAQPNVANVHVTISRLRRKLEKNPKYPEYLHTIRGLGYLFKFKVPDTPHPDPL